MTSGRRAESGAESGHGAGGADRGQDVREDLVTGRVVIVAERRGARPHTIAETRRVPSRVRDCPFCPGNESQTPPEVARIGDGRVGEPGWRVRVFPNKYPIAAVHEVVACSPAHDRTLADLEPDGVADVLAMLRDRAAWHLGRGAVHAAPFVNHGHEAGASIEHPHAQLVALDRTPIGVEQLVARHGDRDLVADYLALARANGTVVTDGDVASWCPYGAASPYESVIAGGTGPRFDRADDASLALVAAALRDWLRRLRAVLGDVAYNAVVHTAGGDGRPTGRYRWHLRCAPRVQVEAGFELGTGLSVNTVSPERAAGELRAARP